MGETSAGASLETVGGAVAGAQRREEPMELPVEALRANPLQPRATFDAARLEELAASIRAEGVLQPVLVRPAEGGYEIVAGERRWRAARMAGLGRVPVVIRDIPDTRILELALIENLQREDLNPMEVAIAYRDLVEDLGLSQEDVARRMGRSRPAVANALRLLELPARVQELVSRGALSAGHARALLGVRDPSAQWRLCERAIREELSVRSLEALVARIRAEPGPSVVAQDAPRKAPHLAALEERLRQRLGTKVEIVVDGGGARGRVVIEFYGHAQFEGLLGALGA